MDLVPRYENLTYRMGLFLGAVIVAVFVLVQKIFHWEISWAILAVGAAAASALVFYWHLKKEIWFWLTIAILLAAQIAVLCAFPVPDVALHQPAMFALGVPDMLLFGFCIKFVGRRVARAVS